MPHFDLFDTGSQNYMLHLADTIHYHGSIANACLMGVPLTTTYCAVLGGEASLRGQRSGGRPHHVLCPQL